MFGAGYSSPSDYETFIRWANWSSRGTTINKIIDIEWTDIFASLVTGTKSRVGEVIPGGRSRIFSPFPQPTGEIRMYRNKIIYKYGYATPAFICCVVWMIWALTCLYMAMAPRYKKKISVSGLSSTINKLSVGRLLPQWASVITGSDHPRHEIGLATRDWIRRDGREKVDISGWPFERPDRVRRRRLRKEASGELGNKSRQATEARESI